jgi:hypothetical protein
MTLLGLMFVNNIEQEGLMEVCIKKMFHSFCRLTYSQHNAVVTYSLVALCVRFYSSLELQLVSVNASKKWS